MTRSLSDDPAARDLGSLGISVSSFSSWIQVTTTFVDSSLCSGVPKRPSELRTPLPALDQSVAREPRQLLQPRDEGLVDLAGQLGCAALVHTLVTANGPRFWRRACGSVAGEVPNGPSEAAFAKARGTARGPGAAGPSRWREVCSS